MRRGVFISLRQRQSLLLLLCALLLIGCQGNVSPSNNDPSKDSSRESDVVSSDIAAEENCGTSDTSSVEAEPHLATRTDGDGGTLAVWWWNAGTVKDETARKKYLDFLEGNQINEIYLCYPNFSREILSDFVKDCGSRGIEVSLLSGDSSWISPDHTGADAVIEEFLTYQASAKEEERLKALHMDVEPHQRKDFGENRQQILQEYADFVARVSTRIRIAGESIEWDIPFWFDDFTVEGENGEGVDLLTHLAKNADTLCLMSYRDTAKAVLELSEKEISLGKTYGCRVICGVDCYSQEGEDVSFLEDGKDRMYKQIKRLYHSLRLRLSTEGYGVAIHYLDTWYQLPN